MVCIVWNTGSVDVGGLDCCTLPPDGSIDDVGNVVEAEYNRKWYD